LPSASKRTGTSSGSNYRTATYRTPLAVDEIAASIRPRHSGDVTMGPPSFDSPSNVQFWFAGDAACDGRYFAELSWKPETPTTADLSSNCED
jgi:hypothetical protein